MAVIISDIQYIPRNMHTAFALLCFVVFTHWLIFPYPSGLLHWHCGNLTIAPVQAKQPWWIWINTSCEFIMNDCITTTKQSTTKPCAYFVGYTVCLTYVHRLIHVSQLYVCRIVFCQLQSMLGTKTLTYEQAQQGEQTHTTTQVGFNIISAHAQFYFRFRFYITARQCKFNKYSGVLYTN